MPSGDNHFGLVDPFDSIMVVIDVQNAFLDKLAPETASALVNNIVWLVEVARWKGVPIAATAEEVDSMATATAIVNSLPADVDLIDKRVFGLTDQPETMASFAAAAGERRTAVLVGLETDVCVLHSALGLMSLGYRVIVVVDAVGSPAPGHELGLDRLRSAGAVLVDAKGLFYEWLRTVAEVERFHRELPHMRAAAGSEL
jgi:nicotinamidase-related amidase